MPEIKLGLIGLGNMGLGHINNIYGGNVKNVKLTAVCDTDQEKLKAAKEKVSPDVACFDSDDAFFEQADIDSVLIAVPHYDHPTLAIRAFEKGLNVLSEKPAGVYTKAVREMNEAAAKSGKVYGIMYNQRTNPIYKKVRQMIEDGELGSIKRVVWIVTTWYRPQAYHDSSSWRSTWKSEGGGVLINQAPHQLDLIQWITGMMPSRVRGFCQFGKYYDIEVEDDVTAYFEYPNGATGLFVTTTGEVPGTNRLEIAGSRGKIVVEDGKLIFYRTVVDEREYNANNTKTFGGPETWKCEIPLPRIKPEEKDHTGILNNFANAILKGEKLLAPGEEGIRGLTLSNAMHLSTWTDDWVNLPIDEDLYFDKLQEKIKTSKPKKKAQKQGAADLSGTF